MRWKTALARSGKGLPMPDSSTGFLSARIWDVAVKIGLVVTPLLGGALIAHEIAVRTLKEDIVHIKEAAFTAKDGSDLRGEVRDMIELRMKEMPPVWFKEQVNKIDSTVLDNAKGIAGNAKGIAENSRGIAEVMSRLARIEAKLP